MNGVEKIWALKGFASKIFLISKDYETLLVKTEQRSLYLQKVHYIRSMKNKGVIP